MAVPVVATSTTAGAASASPVSITKPSGTVAGDLILILVASYDQAGSAVSCSGFASYATSLQNGANIALGTVLYRFADGSEGASFSVAVSPTSYNDIICLRVTGAGSLDGHTEGHGTGATATTGTAFSTTGSDRLLIIHHAGYIGGISSAYTGFTQDVNFDTTNYAYHKSQVAAGSTGTFSASNTAGSGETAWENILIAVAPPAAGSGPPPPTRPGPPGQPDWQWQQPTGVDPTVVVAADVVPVSFVPPWERLPYPQIRPVEVLDVSITQSVDSPTGQPLQEPWLRPPYATGVYQQPRHLVDTSVTQSVDSPTGQLTQDVVFARPAYPLEAFQQPRRLLDISITQSVDAPAPQQPYELVISRPAPFPRQARLSSPDVLAPADTYLGPSVQLVAPYLRVTIEWSYWQETRYVDVTVSQSVDSPPLTSLPPQVYARPRPPYPQATPGVGPLLPADSVPASLPTVAPYLRTVTAVNQYLRRTLDVSITQSVDSPPGFLVQPEGYDRKRAQWPQGGPGVALFGQPDQPAPTIQQLFVTPPISRVPWQPRPRILFPSVDSPSSPFIQTPASYRRAPAADISTLQRRITDIPPPVTVVIGPGIEREYTPTAQTVAVLDGRRSYEVTAQSLGWEDDRRTYEPDAITSEDVQ